MKFDYFERFFLNSSFAYSCHRVIFDEQKRPLDYECLIYNDAYDQLVKIFKEHDASPTLSNGFCKSWKNEDLFEDCVLKSIQSQTTSEIDVKCKVLNKWYRITVVPIEKDVYSCIYNEVTKDYIQNSDIEGFLKLRMDIFCVSSVKGFYVRINQGFEDILGYSAEEVEGEKFEKFVYEEDITITATTINQLKNQQSISKFVNRILHKNGTYRYIEWHSQPNGEFIYSSGRDITEQYNLEKELFKKNRSLGLLTEELKNKNKILKNLAITDDLTGLYNRHFLTEKLKKEIEIADTENHPLSLIIVDLDHFKNVNDTWGHPAGDTVLRQTGMLLGKMVRNQDIVGRIGGEEFIVILPNTNLDVAYAVAERLRKSIAYYQFPIVGHLTASLGVAEKGPFETSESLYERVDNALYKAKESHRDCVAKAIKY